MLSGFDTWLHDELIQINYIQENIKNKKSILIFFYPLIWFYFIKTRIKQGFLFSTVTIWVFVGNVELVKEKVQKQNFCNNLKNFSGSVWCESTDRWT